MTTNPRRHRWQVVRCSTSVDSHGAVIAACSHRWEVVAGWCAALRCATDRYHYDVRATPDIEEVGRG